MFLVGAIVSSHHAVWQLLTCIWYLFGGSGFTLDSSFVKCFPSCIYRLNDSNGGGTTDNAQSTGEENIG